MYFFINYCYYMYIYYLSVLGFKLDDLDGFQDRNHQSKPAKPAAGSPPSVGQVEVAGCRQEPPYCPAAAAHAAHADVAEETLQPEAVEERCHLQGPQDSTGCGVTSWPRDRGVSQCLPGCTAQPQCALGWAQVVAWQELDRQGRRWKERWHVAPVKAWMAWWALRHVGPRLGWETHLGRLPWHPSEIKVW